ncbi:MAG TPA: ABC transporter permease [Thermomicrobiales bacterium]|nr:ABC transporter permease [Thermomicrobiales bacterium]
MTRKYLLQRLGLFLIVIWGAASLNFFLPRMAPGDPIRARLFAMMMQGGYQQTGVEEMVKSYQARFGLDKPLYQQYVNYLWDTMRFDFGYSLSFFPTKAIDLIMRALPWTIGLLTVTTILSFAIGTIIGALMAWPKSPKFLELLLAPMLTLAAIPYYLLALILVYLFAFTFKIFPLSGGYTPGTLPSATWSFWWDVLKHSILPSLSIILAAIGFWAIGIRAMMVTTSGEDYMTFAEARGLNDRTIFIRYALRNAMLPQFTALALSLGNVVSGALIVEVVFTYPGVGSLLYNAIQTSDYFVIYGVVFMVILTIAIATLLVDLFYPLLDPRIRA